MRETRKALAMEGRAEDFTDIEMMPGAGHIAPTSMVCVTVYNEPSTELIKTLSSIVRSFRRAKRAQIESAGKPCVVVVIDGIEKADREVLGFLQRIQLVDLGIGDRRSTRCYFGKPPACMPLDSGVARLAKLFRHVDWIVCVKSHNRGKLHSHALFFRRFCSRFNPEYCFQVDVGTAVALGAVGAMLLHFGSDASVGALAATIVTESLGAGNCVLRDWQLMEFALQAGACWHAEVLSGHLSVLPGQFSGLRWSALSPSRQRTLPRTEDELSCSDSAHDNPQPVNTYLRGLATYSRPIDRLMFLAEDRVIGNEIVLAANAWRLGYCSSAHAVTDACTRMCELRRQRRRWNNSSSICRLWLLSRWPKYLLRRDRGLAEMARFSTAMIWQTVLLLQQLFTPALLVCVICLVVTATRAACRSGDIITPCAAAAAMSIGVLSAGFGPPNASGSRLWRVLRRLGFTAGAVLLILTLSHLAPAESLTLLIAPYLVAVALSCLSLPRHALALLGSAAEFWLINPFMQSYLWVYSITQLHDASWGTKGLTQSNGNATGALRWLRDAVLVSWLAINGSAVWIGLTVEPLYFRGLNPVLEAIAGMFSLTVLMAMCRRVWGHFSTPRMRGRLGFGAFGAAHVVAAKP